MGTPKQLLPFGNSTLLGHTAAVAVEAAVGPVFVVLGANREQIEPALRGLPTQIVANAEWEEGLASSIRYGVSAAMSSMPELQRVILALGDQPMIMPSIYDSLLACYGGMDLAACHYGDTFGTPALFGSAYFDELLSLHGDRGAKSILMANRATLRLVECAAATVDLDTPQDYAAAVADFSTHHLLSRKDVSLRDNPKGNTTEQ